MITRRVELNRRRLRLSVDVCQTPLERARGLLLRKRPPRDQAMLLTRCRAVHTFGLWYPIDVAFCTGDGTVLEVVRAVGPCRVARCHRAGQVWELPAGLAEELDLQAGDRLAAT